MKKYLILFFVIAAVVVVVLIKPVADKNIVVGAILPLSGNTAFIGEDIKRGMDLATNSNVSIIYEDSTGDAKTMVGAYQKLVATNRPDVFIASGTGVEALIPLAEKDKIPLLISVSSASNLPRSGEYIFRYFTNADNDAPTMAAYAVDKIGLRKFAIVYVQDQFGIDYKNIFQREVEQKGGHVVASDAYQYSDFDFKTQIAKIRSSDFDAVYVIGLDYQLVPLIDQIKKAGITKQILSLGTIATADNIKKLGSNAEEIYLTAFCTDGSPAEYTRKFKERYSVPPGFFSEIGYDLMHLIQYATDQGNRPSAIKESLLKVKDIQMNTGIISSDLYGEMIIPMCVKKITSGRIFNTATGKYSDY